MADQRDQGLLVGIDVGGTRIKAVLVSADDPALAPAGPPPGPGHADPVAAEQSGHGIPQIREPHPLASAVRPTPHPAAETLAEAVGEIVDELLQTAGATRAQVAGLGMAVLGLVDEARGIGVYSANAGWRDLPIRDLVRDRLGVPVAIGHDVRTGLRAEARFGAAAGARHALFLAIGTGVAGALMVDGRLIDADGYAGELGHVIVDPLGPICGCGGRGCLEAIASASAIGRTYTERTGIATDAAGVAELVRAGDLAAERVWQGAVEALASAVAAAVTITGVDHVVVGGGLSNSGALLLDRLTAAVDARLTFQRPPRVVRAALGDRAGALGAVLLADKAAR